MLEDIPPLPLIPERLRTAATQGSLVPFVGAGLSKLGGCPDWKEFASRCLAFFLKGGKIDYSYLEQVAGLAPRVKLSLARGLANEHGRAIDYASLLKPTDPAAEGRGRRAYGALSRLAKVFVTTNYDDWLDSSPSLLPGPTADLAPATSPTTFRRNIYYKVEELTFDKLNQPNSVLHIHGSVKDPASMIVTTSDYLVRYANHAQVAGDFVENGYLAFLTTLFRLKNVVFIGYGLEELEILEYVVQKARQARPSAETIEGRREEPRHFMLQGFFSHQLPLANSLTRYFSDEIGVQLLPFSLDKKNWDQLVDVLEYLAGEIPAGSPLSLQKRGEMRRLLDG